MGYRSDVRIRLTKKDFERLKNEFEQEIVPKFGYNYLFNKDNLIYKELKKYSYWKVTNDGEDIETKEDCVYFGWNWVKWYDGYEDVDFIMNFIQDCDQYAFCRIGEDMIGDVETRENNMDMIGYYYAFDEED